MILEAISGSDVQRILDKKKVLHVALQSWLAIWGRRRRRRRRRREFFNHYKNDLKRRARAPGDVPARVPERRSEVGKEAEEEIGFIYGREREGANESERGIAICDQSLGEPLHGSERKPRNSALRETDRK